MISTGSITASRGRAIQDVSDCKVKDGKVVRGHSPMTLWLQVGRSQEESGERVTPYDSTRTVKIAGVKWREPQANDVAAKTNYPENVQGTDEMRGLKLDLAGDSSSMAPPWSIVYLFLSPPPSLPSFSYYSCPPYTPSRFPHAQQSTYTR